VDRRKRLSNVRLYTGIGGVLLPIGEWNATRGAAWEYEAKLDGWIRYQRVRFRPQRQSGY